MVCSICHLRSYSPRPKSTSSPTMVDSSPTVTLWNWLALSRICVVVLVVPVSSSRSRSRERLSISSRLASITNPPLTSQPASGARSNDALMRPFCTCFAVASRSTSGMVVCSSMFYPPYRVILRAVQLTTTLSAVPFRLMRKPVVVLLLTVRRPSCCAAPEWLTVSRSTR